ncbi:MAG TPA: flagellar FliJ family protein [Candidatus Deferrimicrobiaceae bacterium]|jgi:flagellar export protein FliJ
MADRAQLKRIANVRHLREVQEKQEAKKVALAVAAVTEAERLIEMLDAESERFRKELDEAMKDGMPPEDVAMSHAAWLDLREKRKLIVLELGRRRERLLAADAVYRQARIARRQMDKWEEKVGETLRIEDDRKMASMVDEIAVQRYGWRRA